MLDVLADWRDDLVWPFAVGLLGVASTWLPARDLRLRSVTVVGGSALIFLVGVRARLPDVLDALVSGPLWFSGVALVAGVVTAATMVRLFAEGREPEGLLVLGVGLGAAAAALPDVEVLPGAAALWIPWVLADQSPHASGPRRPARDEHRSIREWMNPAVSALVAALVLVALVDGARGRPGSLLIAPIVVGPVVLTALLPAPWSRTMLVARAGATGVVGLLVARHAGLGAGTTRPLVGSVIGLLALVALAAAVSGRPPRAEVRRPRGRRG